MGKDNTELIVSWIIGILGIIFLVFLLNVFSMLVNFPFLNSLVEFINNNFFYIIIISLLFFLGTLSHYNGFPINLAYPFLDALGGAFLVYFLIALVEGIDNYLGTGIGSLLFEYSYIISVIIFLLIFVFGYITLIKSWQRKSRHKRKKKKDDKKEDKDS
ncbi:MAG: hypothetical protein ACOC1P_06220 [Minisyncoccales bacterium]